MNPLRGVAGLNLLLAAALGAGLLPVPDAAAQAGKSAAPAPGSLESFSLIAQRNIFDPNRHPKSGPVRKRKINPEAVARAEGFALVGTMIHENGKFAFFDGTEPAYRKVLQSTNAIADFTVREITAGYVRLEGKSGLVTLPVGMQMKKLGPNDWQIISITAWNSAQSDAAAAPAEPDDKQEPEAAQDGADQKPPAQPVQQETKNE